jgi:catechol 2,3-dioxygenase-like lactoylglutathione lyase family enzyme
MSGTSAITGLLHVAIKTMDLESTVAFYTEVIGLRSVYRPDFGFPGAWLGVPTPVGEAIIHLYAGGPALAAGNGVVPQNTGAIDHLSVTAIGWNGFRERFERFGLPWREFVIPNTTYWQLFVFDPNGVQLELTFDAAAERIPVPDIPDEKKYRAGEIFFDPAIYVGLRQRIKQCAA